MNKTKRVATIALSILLGLVAYELFRTGKSQATPGGDSPQAVHGSAIDQSGQFHTPRAAHGDTEATLTGRLDKQHSFSDLAARG